MSGLGEHKWECPDCGLTLHNATPRPYVRCHNREYLTADVLCGARNPFDAMAAIHEPPEVSTALTVGEHAELVPGFMRDGQRFVPAREGDVFVPVLRERIHMAGAAEIIGPVPGGEPSIELGNVLRESSFLPARRMPDGSVFVLDPDAPLPPAPPSSGELEDNDNEDVAEQRDRARGVAHALESCEEELARLEDIPSADAGDVNAISAAKGYVQRARAALDRRFA